MCLSCRVSRFPLCPQGETVHRDGEWDRQRGEVSGGSQPQVSGQLPWLPPGLQQPQPQSQQLPALPHRYRPSGLSGFWSSSQEQIKQNKCPSHSVPAPGFDSNCCNGVTSNKSHSSSPHSHKPCPPSSGSTLPASDVSLNGNRSQQPLTRFRLLSRFY